MKKNIPTLKTDRGAERFVATADLSKYDLSGFKVLKMKIHPILASRCAWTVWSRKG